MQKRGQVTFFMVIALAIVIIVGLYYYMAKYNAKSKSSRIIKENTDFTSANIVKIYVESCLKSVSEDAIFNRIGVHGGYIDPKISMPIEQQTPFLDNSVPYYLEANCPDSICSNFKEYFPDDNIIIKELTKYIRLEFEKCFDTKVFENVGLNVTKLTDNSKIGVNLNEEDVTIKLNYPITIIRKGTETNIDSFAVTLPIRLKSLYSSSISLIEKIKNLQSNKYTITPDDCKSFDKNGLTNVYVKNSDNGPKEIIQFVDFSTYKEKYFNSYIFQFAVKNIKIEGSCAG